LVTLINVINYTFKIIKMSYFIVIICIKIADKYKAENK